jgi:transcriptional regulator with XRE-family HTH domain
MIGSKLKMLREMQGYRLYEVAQGTGLSKASISRYENSKRENIGLNELRLLAAFYKVDIEYLTNDDEAMPLRDKEIQRLLYRLSDAAKMKVYQLVLSLAAEEKII